MVCFPEQKVERKRYIPWRKRLGRAESGSWRTGSVRYMGSVYQTAGQKEKRLLTLQVWNGGDASCTNMELEFESQNPCKKLSTLVCTCNCRAGEVDTGRSLGLADQPT